MKSSIASAPASGAADSATKSPLIHVRTRTDADKSFAAALLAHAFGPGRYARSAFRVREYIESDNSLGLIAEIDNVAIGSVEMTPIAIDGTPGYLLGPLAIEPSHRNLGAGRLLVKKVCKLALSRDMGKFVLLVGDAPYYAPLGFVPVPSGAIEFPGPVDPARVLVHWGSTQPQALAGAIAPTSF